MRRATALVGLALLAGCHRPRADQPAPGADGEAQARTAAKTLADLQAADDASRGPPPYIAPARPVEARSEMPRATAEPDEAGAEPGNAGAEPEGNDTTPD